MGHKEWDSWQIVREKWKKRLQMRERRRQDGSGRGEGAMRSGKEWVKGVGRGEEGKNKEEETGDEN